MKQFLKKIINWHLLPIPKDITILSFYEFFAYLAILSYVIWLYNKVQIIPVFDESIYTKTIIEPQKDDVKPVIEYHIPMTFAFIGENVDSTYNSTGTDGFVSISFERKEGFELREGSQRSSFLTPDSTRDSLKVIYSDLLARCVVKQTGETSTEFQQRKEKVKANLNYLSDKYGVLYAKVENINTWKKPQKERFDPWRFILLSGFGQTCVKGNMIRSECFIDRFPNQKYTASPTNSPYSRPKWNRLYDISQSYFNLKMDGDSLDGKIIIDFMGATEFSNMTPLPDAVSYSSITFEDPEKIKYIRENGLRFHAKFIEIEGLQRSRLFAITSVGAALIAIFITFLVLALYKTINNIDFSKKHHGRNSDTPQEDRPQAL